MKRVKTFVKNTDRMIDKPIMVSTELFLGGMNAFHKKMNLGRKTEEAFQVSNVKGL